tara:strand:- start:19 stop:693 length:675 start_codon:yes stop_codon:yes gene_type:complete
MMPQQKSKKILIYIFLFLIIATFNNKNLNNINLGKINNISITGLDKKNNFKLSKNLNFLEDKNIFFLNKVKIKKIIEENTLVEQYTVFRLYPSSLNININKTNFLAIVKKDGNNFLLGSNGKLTSTNEIIENLPLIFGDFKITNFFELKTAMDETNFNFDEVRNLFFFKSGRWDIETKYGLLIKLPKQGLKKSLESFISFLETKDLKGIKEIDLRQYNQIIING